MASPPMDPKQWLRENPPPPQDPTAMPGTTMLPEEDPWSTRAQELLRLSGNSFTFGMGDRARAVGQVLWGQGASGYNDALQQQVAESERIRAKNPGAAIGAEMFGGIAQAPFAAPLAAAGTLGRTVPWLTRAAVGAGEAGVYGAVQGAGNTYSGNPMDYVTNAGRSAAIAMPIGAVAPGVGALASNVAGRYGHLRNPMEIIRSEPAIPRTLGQAAGADAPSLRQMQDRLLTTPPPGGHQEMLPDAGPAMLGTAQGAALGNAPQASNLRGQLDVRNRGTAPRVNQGLQETLGPAQMPDDIAYGIRQRMRDLGTEYDRVLQGARAVDTSGLAQTFDALIVNTRGAPQQAAREVRAMLEIPTNPGNLDPYPPAVQAARSAIRSRLDALARSPDADRGVIAVLTQADQELTRRLQASVPGITEVDAAYHELGRQMRGVATGQQILQKGPNAVPPEAVARDFGLPPPPGAPPPDPAAVPHGSFVGPSATPMRIREGARAELERIVGTNKNDLATLRNLLGEPQDWNQQKLATVFGPERANRLMDVLDAETRMRGTYTDVVGNSLTAQRTASRKAMETAEGKIPWDATFFGSATRGVQEAYRALTRSTSEGAKENMARILAERDPAQIDRLIDRLLAIAPKNTSRADIARLIATQGAIGGAAAAPQ